MYIIHCDFCHIESKGSDSYMLPEGWAVIETQGEYIGVEREHLCPRCRDGLMIEE